MSLLHMLKHMLARKWPDKRSGKEKKRQRKISVCATCKTQTNKNSQENVIKFFVLFFKKLNSKMQIILIFQVIILFYMKRKKKKERSPFPPPQ